MEDLIVYKYIVVQEVILFGSVSLEYSLCSLYGHLCAFAWVLSLFSRYFHHF